jgi:hypothetical protein
MFSFLKKEIFVSWIVNPFFLYCIAFSLAGFLYVWDWSNLYTELSFKLVLFFIISFLPFILLGYLFIRKGHFKFEAEYRISFPVTYIFILILVLGSMNLAFGGVLPVLTHGSNYGTFGMPIINPFFNTLCIYSSVIFFYSFLINRKNKLLVFIVIILVFQVILFRRSTIIWILTSMVYLYLKQIGKIPFFVLIFCLIIFIFGSFWFGYLGTKRNDTNRSRVISDLDASDRFKNLNISHNHYMTYLYLCSPLANLQKNVNDSKGCKNENNFKDFIFYSILPQSLTRRVERGLSLSSPKCSLISPSLIVGSYYMMGFKTFGWLGMIILAMFLILYIVILMLLIPFKSPFYIITVVLLTTTVSMLIFDNMITRSDVILMLFGYPFLFHWLNKVYIKKLRFCIS